MKKCIKRFNATFLVVLMLFCAVLTIVPKVTVNAASVFEMENNDTIAMANAINFGDRINGNISENNDRDYYKITLGSSGKINISFSAYMEYINLYIYDADGNEINRHNYIYWNNTTQKITADYSLDLTKGIYYVCFENCYNRTGNYDFKTSFTSSNESFSETGDGNNNTMITANSINLGQQYNGQIALTDDRDFYKFTLNSSGKLQLSFNAYMERINLYIYDVDGNEIVENNGIYWNDTTQKITADYSFNLTKGIYYVCFENYYNRTGNYDFKTSFTSSNESFSETGNGNNNTMITANSINLGQQYNGQIALTDGRDFYKFTLNSSGELKLSFTAYMERINLYIYDADGNEIVEKHGIYWDSTTQKITADYSFDLTKGIYYVCFENYYSQTGNYYFRVGSDVFATGVKLNTTRTWLGRGESYQLNATVSPSNATNKKITWTSSNNNIATVSNGKVTAKKDGTVTITAKTSNGKTATCKITVQPPASKITLNKSTLYLGVGEKFQLTSSVQSGTASAKRGFSSSNNNICYTSGSGQLTAKKTGTAYITVKTFNGKTAQCKVVVQPPANKINLNKSTLYLGVGEKFQLTSWVDSGTASTKRAWSSSNNNICYTSSSGQLTAKKTGTAYITVKTFNGKTAQCKVVVQPPASKISLNKSTLYLGVGEKFQLTSWVDSGTASTKRAWSSSNNNICYTSGSGQLTAKKTGTAYITVKTFNGKTAQCKVVVQPPAKAVHISKSWLTLHVGQKFQLSSWVDAGTASTKRAWSSSDNNICYTSGNGLLTAKKEGTAYITVKTFNGVSSTLKVKVIK